MMCISFLWHVSVCIERTPLLKFKNFTNQKRKSHKCQKLGEHLALFDMTWHTHIHQSTFYSWLFHMWEEFHACFLRLYQSTNEWGQLLLRSPRYVNVTVAEECFSSSLWKIRISAEFMFHCALLPFAFSWHESLNFHCSSVLHMNSKLLRTNSLKCGMNCVYVASTCKDDKAHVWWRTEITRNAPYL